MPIKSQIRLQQLTGSVLSYKPARIEQQQDADKMVHVDLTGSFGYIAQALSNIHGNIEYGAQVPGTISFNKVGTNILLDQNQAAQKIHLDSEGQVDIDAVKGLTISQAASGPNEDLKIEQTGGNDSSILVESAGTGNDAISLATTAGGIDITVAGAGAGADLDLSANTSINIVAAESATDAVKIEASAGGIDILASGAAAGEDIDITATGSSVNISSTEAIADAITINASGGGVDITSAATFDVDIIAGNNLVIDAQGNTSGDGVSVQLGADNGTTKLKLLNNTGTEKFSVDDEGNVVIKGNLTTEGTTTTLDTQHLLIEDGIIVLNKNETSRRDGGIVFRHNAAEGKVFGYDIDLVTDGMFKLGQTNTAAMVDGTATSLTYSDDGELSLGGLFLSASVNSAENKVVLDDFAGVNNRALAVSGSHALGLYAKVEDILLTAQAQNKAIKFEHDDAGSLRLSSFDASQAAGAQPRTQYGQMEHMPGTLGFAISSKNDNPLSLGTAGLDIPISAILSERGHKFEFVNSEAAVGGSQAVYGHVTGSAAGLILSGGDAAQLGDILFKVNKTGASVEVFRVDASAGSILMEGTSPIHFGDANLFLKRGGSGQLSLQNDAKEIEISATDNVDGKIKFAADVHMEFKDSDHSQAGMIFQNDALNDIFLNFNHDQGSSAPTVGNGGFGLRADDGVMKVKNQADSSWEEIATLADINAGNTADKPFSGSLGVGQQLNVGNALDSLAGIGTFDLSSIDAADEKKKVDVYVNGQLLISGSEGATGNVASDADYALFFGTSNRNAASLKFNFVLEEDDTIIVHTR